MQRHIEASSAINLLLKEHFDKNSASDYLSNRLGKLVSAKAVCQLHIRKSCQAADKFIDGRLRWRRSDLDAYIQRRYCVA